MHRLYNRMPKKAFGSFLVMTIKTYFICLGVFLLFIVSEVFAATPAIFFSDMTDGPTSGWERSNTQGAAVTIWGTNLGTIRGDSTVTVCGVTLNQDTDFAEWGVINPADGTGADYSSARGLQRITFWLKSSMVTSAGTISVATSSGTSNTIPFYCRVLGSNKIFFVSTSGNDNNNGLTVAAAWRNPYKAKATMAAGDVTYVKAGNYTAYDPTGKEFSNYNLYFNNGGSGKHANGTANKSITLASYPGEIATLGEDDSGLAANIAHRGADILSYWSFSKFKMRSAGSTTNWPQGTAGGDDHIRFIGNDVATTGPKSSTNFAFNGGNLGQTYLFFYGNHSHDAAYLPRGGKGNSAYPLYFNGYGAHNFIYIAWNEFDHNSNGRGMQLYGHTVSDWMDHVYIHDNYIHDNFKTGAVLGGGDGGTGLNGKAMGQLYQFIRNVYFYNNILHDNGGGSPDGYPCLLMGGESWGSIGGNWYIYNNICYHSADGEIFVSSHSKPTLIEMRNNIIVPSPGKPYYVDNVDKEGNYFRGSNNLYYGAGNGPAWDTNRLDNVNPQFIVEQPVYFEDFRLSSDSPAIGRGYVVDGGNNTILLMNDFLGHVRGNTFDIGPYRYNSGQAAAK